MFSIHAIFGKYVNDTVFEVFAYWVPELLPILVELVTIFWELRSSLRATKFASSLYDYMTDNEGSGIPYHVAAIYGSHSSLDSAASPYFSTTDTEEALW